MLSGAGIALADPAQIVLLHTPFPTYEDSARAIGDLLSKKGHRCELISCPEGGGADEDTSATSAPGSQAARADSEAAEITARISAARPKLVVAVGTAAALQALRASPDLPVVFCLVPSVLDRTFMTDPAKYRSRMAGLTTDIAPETQVEWIKRLSPRATRIGVLHGSRSRLTAMAIAQAAKRVNLQISAIPAHRDRIPEAIAELDRLGCDGLLMLADSDVYNAAAVQRLLLWGIRGRKPVWAFSANIVKAGAFAGLYTDSTELARQTAAMVEGLLDGKSITSIGLKYPEKVNSAVNERTADLIGIEIDRKTLDGVTARYGGQP